MFVWFAENAERGQRWQPTQAEANKVRNGGPIAQQTVAEGGRAMMCNLLNNCERPEELTHEEIRQSNTPEAQEAAKELMRPDSDYAGGYSNYESPFGARSCLAGMDAQALKNAIKQMDGTNLGIIALAVSERLAVLGRGSAL